VAWSTQKHSPLFFRNRQQSCCSQAKLFGPLQRWLGQNGPALQSVRDDDRPLLQNCQRLRSLDRERVGVLRSQVWVKVGPLLRRHCVPRREVASVRAIHGCLIPASDSVSDPFPVQHKAVVVLSTSCVFLQIRNFLRRQRANQRERRTHQRQDHFDLDVRER